MYLRGSTGALQVKHILLHPTFMVDLVFVGHEALKFAGLYLR